MKKFLLSLAVACMTLSASATTKILLSQNFEDGDPASLGWTCPVEGVPALSIASDEYGKFLQISLGNNNGRTTSVNWGQNIYLNEDGSSKLEDGTYTVKYDFAIPTGSTNQYNGAFTLFTNGSGTASQPWRGRWTNAGDYQNWIFDMTQDGASSLGYCVCAPEKENVAEDGNVTYSIDLSDVKTLTAGMWYTVTCEVSTEDRTVDYTVESVAGDVIASGTREVPEVNPVNQEAISMFAEGLWIMLARYNTVIYIDNVQVSIESDSDFANDPVVALTRLGKTADEQLDLNVRAYTISFLEGETLHVEGTNGQTVEVEWADCDGAYVYETTTSGTLKAWTTCGDATSKVIETVVDCTPVALPAAEATISSVEAGFAKTYTLTVSNAEVPLKPTIFINYKFTGKDGSVIEKEDEASGVKVTLPGEGTLEITTAAFGYQATTTSVVNDVEFATKTTYDFARMSKEDIEAAISGGTWSVTNSATTSGFSNWTARKRLYYNLAGSETVNDEGATVYTAVYPFGFIAEDNTTNVLNVYDLDRSAIAETTADEYFQGLTIFPERGKVAEGGLPNVGMILHVGLYNNQTSNNNNNVYVNGLDKTDFVVVNYINNYGGNSNHPVCATDDEYYAQLEGENAVISVAAKGTQNEETGLYSVVHALYRVDTAITKITVYKNLSGDSGVAEITIDENAPVEYYNLQGIRVENPTTGLYIKRQGKVATKVLVK